MPKFKEAHPDCGTYHSKYSDQYNKIIIESVGGSGDNDAEKEEKIIRNISKNVVGYGIPNDLHFHNYQGGGIETFATDIPFHQHMTPKNGIITKALNFEDMPKSIYLDLTKGSDINYVVWFAHQYAKALMHNDTNFTITYNIIDGVNNISNTIDGSHIVGNNPDQLWILGIFEKINNEWIFTNSQSYTHLLISQYPAYFSNFLKS